MRNSGNFIYDYGHSIFPCAILVIVSLKLLFYLSYLHCHRIKILSSHTFSTFGISCLNMVIRSLEWIFNPMDYTGNIIQCYFFGYFLSFNPYKIEDIQKLENICAWLLPEKLQGCLQSIIGRGSISVDSRAENFFWALVYQTKFVL